MSDKEGGTPNPAQTVKFANPGQAGLLFPQFQSRTYVQKGLLTKSLNSLEKTGDDTDQRRISPRRCYTSSSSHSSMLHGGHISWKWASKRRPLLQEHPQYCRLLGGLQMVQRQGASSWKMQILKDYNVYLNFMEKYFSNKNAEPLPSGKELSKIIFG